MTEQLDGVWGVYIFQSSLHLSVEPVLHRYSYSNPEADFTGCGRILYDRSRGDRATSLPTRHALRFGRPCKICFPDDG